MRRAQTSIRSEALRVEGLEPGEIPTEARVGGRKRVSAGRCTCVCDLGVPPGVACEVVVGEERKLSRTASEKDSQVPEHRAFWKEKKLGRRHRCLGHRAGVAGVIDGSHSETLSERLGFSGVTEVEGCKRSDGFSRVRGPRGGVGETPAAASLGLLHPQWAALAG